MFLDAGWLIPDPENPARKARDMSEGRGLVMSSEVADHILNLLRGGSKKPDLVPVPQPKVQKLSGKKKPDPRPSTPESQPKKSADTRQPGPSGDSGRPPAAVKQIPKDATEIVEEFIRRVRAGDIPGTEKTDKDGVEWISVGASVITRFATAESKSQIPAGMVVTAFSHHKECKHQGTRIMVQK